jgi:protein O-mannosyl-transferase
MNRNLKKKAKLEKSAAESSGISVSPTDEKTNLKTIGISFFLLAIVWIVFGQTWRYDFINYDDDVYVYGDPVVTHGLTLEGVKAAFSTQHSDNWVPLTTLSHMLDYQLFGPNAGDHHLTNVLLQAAAAILLFLALRQMTGFLWRSAFIAAVFAIHPLRVESVAWISERKDVLSGVFFMLTLWAYVRYVRSSKPLGWYLATLFCLILALLSKPSVVTLPFVLLLLDYWPLKRFNATTLKRLLLEKIPLLLLSLACCIPTMISEKPGIKQLEFCPIPLRIENAIVSYVIHMERMVYPANLAVLYPYPSAIPWWEVALAGILLAGICVIVWAQRQTRPWLLMGWLWYLGMLLPNIGFIQVGAYSRADRYTYLPQIGLVLALTWAAADYLYAGWRYRQALPGGCSAIILAALIFCAHRQVIYWRSSELLWTHALACTSNNFIAHNNLGRDLYLQGRPKEAMAHYQKAVEIAPGYFDAQVNLASALSRAGNLGEAIAHYRAALQIDPTDAGVQGDFASTLLQNGNVAEAIAHFQKSLQLNPANAEAENNLGYAMTLMGDDDEAIIHFQRALQIEPNNLKAQWNLADALMRKGRTGEAIVHYRQALQLKPDEIQIENNLALLLAIAPLASDRNGAEALKLAQQANQLSGGQNPVILHTLAAAYAETGQFDNAIQTLQKAIALARTAGQPQTVEQLNAELKLYQAGRPLREPLPP